MDTRESIVGKTKTTITEDKTRTTMVDTRTTKTITEIQEISRATMEHQDTPITFSAIFARRNDTWNLFATSNSKKKNNTNRDKKEMWC